MTPSRCTILFMGEDQFKKGLLLNFDSSQYEIINTNIIFKGIEPLVEMIIKK